MPLRGSYCKYLFHYVTSLEPLLFTCGKKSAHYIVLSDRAEERSAAGLGLGGVQHGSTGRGNHGDIEQRQTGRYPHQGPVLYSKHSCHQHLYEFCQQSNGKQVKQL